MPIALAGGRATHDVCGSTCVEWWRTRLPEERDLVEFLHEAQRAVAVREGRPDSGPFVPPKRSCTAASRKRAARESAKLAAQVEQAYAQRQQELRDGLAWSPLPFHTPPGPPPAVPEAVTPKRRKAAPEAPLAAPRPEPREAAPVAPEGKGGATETPWKRQPRRRGPWIDMIGTIPSSGRW
ncbi:MAG: hypothetical protein WA890_12095 [Micromonospora sp.]